jgi:hypothetical protein
VEEDSAPAGAALVVTGPTSDARTWLDRCEGYAVYAGKRHLGYVSSVLHAAGTGEPTGIVVRLSGRRRVVPATEVVNVDPADARVELSPASQRAD